MKNEDLEAGYTSKLKYTLEQKRSHFDGGLVS